MMLEGYTGLRPLKRLLQTCLTEARRQRWAARQRSGTGGWHRG